MSFHLYLPMLRARTVGIGKRLFSGVAAKGIDVISPLIGLNDERCEYYELAKTFADKEMRPFASKWDREAYFPLETFQKFSELGFGGMFVREDVGGSALNRADAGPIIEALATGCVGTTALLTIHNANALCIDKYGTDEQRQKWLPKLVNMDLLVSFCLTEPGPSHCISYSFSTSH